MSSPKVINFGAGPAKLPEEVVKKAQEELVHYGDTGISVMEMSHRSASFQKILDTTIQDLKELMNIPSNYKVLFLQGGGTGQFAAVPLNLCSSDEDIADYFVTGTWSAKAAKEAEKYCKVNRVLPKTDKYTGISDPNSWQLDPNAKYVYYCDNETIHGIEFPSVPETNGIPVVADMSSNILTRPVDVSKYGVIFAGCQKNIGIAGLTLVVVREDLLGRTRKICPTVLDYKVMSDNNSLLNTPPTFAIYVMGLVLKWIKQNGGVAGMEQRCKTKSKMIYDIIDSSKGFYYSPVQPEHRSRVNIPFRIGGQNGDEKLEKKFLEETQKRNMLSLKGHRSVGGLRASLFNAVTLDEAKELANLMKEFYEKHHQD